MGVQYKAISWNKQKKIYDRTFSLVILQLIVVFVGGHIILNPNITLETLIIRTSALVAIILLHFILCIGPLCRINPVFLPLLYNRRHLGVTMFLFAGTHSVFSIIQFHTLGDIHPIASIFLSNLKYNAISDFPFQVLGFFALIIFFLMAATSHDFWLKNLGPKFWKSLHMLVYIAYSLIILHVALGILQYENKPVYWLFLIAGFSSIAALHLWSGLKEWQSIANQKYWLKDKGFFEVANVGEIPDNCGKGIWLNGQNIAIFKYDNQISAVNNVCRHQMGPLSEGQIVEGCITCPWHGYQYKPQDGQSPPPFTEQLETYEVYVVKDKIWVNPTPKKEGTYIEPIQIK